MRSFATLVLLLLALPGLVLPAGLWWHVCRCVAPVRTETRACCASHAAPAPTAPTCCSARTKADDGSPLRVVPKCGCEWKAVGDDRPDPTPPEASVAIATATVLPFVPFVLPSESLPPPNPAWTRTTSRAPPGTHRNLPLRS